MSSVNKLIAQIESAYKQIENKENIEFNKAIMRQACIDLYNSVDSLGLEKGYYPETSLRINQIIDEPNEATQYNTPTESVSETIETTVAEPIIEEQSSELIANPVEEISETITPEDITPAIPETKETAIPLVEKLNKAVEPVINLVDKQKETPIADLNKAISISKKFEFINSLFEEQAELYKESIQTIQNAESYEKATAFIESHLSTQFNWNEHEKLAAEFFSLVRRRFL
jgi:hypothetical protein